MPALTQTGRRLIQALLAALAGLGLACALHWGGLLDVFEARTYDWRARLLAATDRESPPIRVVFLDQQSLDWGAAENGLGWPWPREVYGAVADFCRRGGAGSLAFDVLFTEPSRYGVADDEALGLATETFGRVVLPVFLGRDTGQDLTWPAYARGGLALGGLEAWAGRDWRRAQPMTRASFPVPELAARAAFLGNVHQDPDPDGVYRRIGLFAVFDNRPVPSLALAAYLAARPQASVSLEPDGMTVDGRSIPLDGRGLALIRYGAPKATYRSYSASAIIRSELLLREGKPPLVSPEEFRDAFVFFGFSAPGLFDLRPAPVSGVYSGVEIHAQALAGILSGDFLSEVPLPAALLLTGLLALGAALCCSLGATTLWALTAIAVFAPLPVALACGAYAAGHVLPLMLLEVATGLALGVSILLGYATEGRQKRFIKSAFRQYLSPVVIEELLRHPERMRLGGERRVLSIFFSDLQGFTSLSESLSPEALTQFLNEYLTAMTDIIMAEGGTVDKYEGDAIIAFWNAPLDQPDHAARALRAALRCQDRLAELRPAFRERVGTDLVMRIGLNTGPAVVGNMGSHSRFDYTMLGDAVNLAARLEGLNKQFGTRVMVTGSLLEAAGDAFAARELGRVVVVGRSEPVAVYEPMWQGERDARAQDLRRFEAALAHFLAGRTEAALEGFEALADRDPAAAAYVRQCRAVMAQGPGPREGGVWVMTSK